MASKAAIAAIFNKLLASDVAGGPRTPEGIHVAVEDWVDLLSDVTDDELVTAYRVYRRDSKACQYWPQPGTLIDRIPSRAIAALDDADDAWAEVEREWIRHGSAIVFGRPYVPSWIGGPREQTIAAGLVAVNGLRGLTTLSGETAKSFARRDFLAAYRTAKKGAALAVEGAAVAQIVGPTAKRIEAAK
jgi:hypothetical protein